MSLELASLALVGGLILLLALGAEVFVAVGVVAAFGLLVFVNQPLGQFAFTSFESMNSFVLTAVPLFIFMGAIFSNTGIIRSLFDAANKWAHVLPGGIVGSVIAANGLFGAMCGSTVAATATFGQVSYPEMERLGYSPRLSLGTLAVAGILSAAIPPSATLVVYGAWSNVSVARLFAAVLMPGIILMLLLMITVVVQVKLNPKLVPQAPKTSWGEKLRAIRDLLPWLGVIALVLGVIFGGIMTPTESAAVGVLGSIILALAYRRMTFTAFKESMWTAVKLTSMVALLMVTARVLSQVFQYVGTTALFSEFMLDLPFGKYGILAVIALIYFIGGMLISDWSMLLLTIPFVLPVVTALGFSPIWFGIWYIMVGEVGLITPPFGLHLFVLHTVVPKHDVMTIALGALPFIIPMILTGVIITAFPQIVLWLPNLLY